MRSLASILVLSTLLAGCGFYLKGQRPAPAALESVQVSYEQPYRVGDPPVVMALQNRLRARDALAQTGAASHIHISNMRDEKRVLSVSPIDGRAAEYELTSFVTFDFKAQGKALIQGQTLSVRRDYSFNNNARLAADAEEKDLLAGMQRELANLILLRAESALKAEPIP